MDARSALIAKTLPATAAVLIAAALTACAPDSRMLQPKPDLITDNGTWIYLHAYSEGLTLADANAMEEYLLTRLDGVDGFDRATMQGCLSEAVVGLFSAEELSAQQGRKVAGMQRDNVLQVAVYPDMWSSAYVHEQAHWLQQCERGISDPEHKVEPKVWSVVNERGNWETQAH